MERPPRRSSGRGFGVLIVVLVVLAILAVVADRATVKLAEARVSSRLQSQLGTTAKPAITIEGFPFLTQLVAKRLSSVHVVADDVVTNQSAVPVKHLDLRLRDVTSPNLFTTMTAGRVDGTATIGFPAVQKLVGQPVTFAGNGKVALQLKTTIVTLPVTATVTGRPQINVADQTLTLADPDISVAGVNVPAGTSQALLATLVKPTQITGVPFGLSLGSVTADENGLTAALTGSNIPLSR